MLKMRVAQTLEQIGLADLATRPAGTLSYGDVAMLEIGMALISEPTLLLLDEPTCGMSPAETSRAVAKIRDLARTIDIVIIEHDMDVVFGIADDITVLAQGRSWPVAVRPRSPTTSASAKPISAAPKTRISSRRRLMLSLRDVQVHIGKLHILQGVNFEVKAGEATALLGRNGVGKTTTLRAIMGLVSRSGGAIKFDDFDLSDYPAHEIPRKGIGYVPQGRGIFPNLSVLENLNIGVTGKRDTEREDYVFTCFPNSRSG